jgi:hypothetical protein
VRPNEGRVKPRPAQEANSRLRLPRIDYSDLGPDDHAPTKQMQLARFDGKRPAGSEARYSLHECPFLSGSIDKPVGLLWVGSAGSGH